MNERDADAALAVIKNDLHINEMQQRISNRIISHHRDPVAGCAGPAAADDARPRVLRAGADGRSRVAASPSRLASSRSLPALKRGVDLPAMGELVARQVHGVLLALINVDENAAREVAAADDARRPPVSPDARRPRGRDAVGSRECRSGHSPALRGLLHRAHRRPGHEHRRRRRVPGVGPDRGLERLTMGAPAPSRVSGR